MLSILPDIHPRRKEVARGKNFFPSLSDLTINLDYESHDPKKQRKTDK